MAWYTILGILGSIIGVMSASFAVLRYMIVHEIRGVGAELRPNGGASFRDHVDRRFSALDGRVDGIDGRIDGIDARLNRMRR